MKKLFKALKDCKEIDATDSDGNTSLMEMVKQKQYLSTCLLLHEGASVIHPNKDGNTPFQLSLKQEDGSEIAKLLWSHIQREGDAADIFMRLCTLGDLQAIRYCLDNVYSPNCLKRILTPSNSDSSHIQKQIEWRDNKEEVFPYLQSLQKNCFQVLQKLELSYCIE